MRVEKMSTEDAIKHIDAMIYNTGIVRGFVPDEYDIKALRMAVEALKAQKWFLCSEKMPEEREWIGTKHFGTTISDTVYVTFEKPNGERFAKHLSFQNGKLSGSDQQSIDVFFKGSVPIAWRPLPEPWKEQSNEQTDGV